MKVSQAHVVLQKILASFASVFGGLITGTAITTIVTCTVYPPDRFPLAEYWSSLAQYFLLVGITVLPIWLFIFMPFYVLLSRKSRLWSMPICTGLGAAFGAGVVILYFFSLGVLSLFFWDFILQGALIGGFTCMFGTIAHKCFVPET